MMGEVTKRGAGLESVLGVYGRQSSFADMEFDDAVAAIEANDFRDLRCHNIIAFAMSAEVLGEKLDQLCLEDDELLEDLRLEQRAGAILLRVAPVNGNHVKLVDLANLIAEVDAARDAAEQS